MTAPALYRVRTPDGQTLNQAFSFGDAIVDSLRIGGLIVEAVSIVTTADLDALRDAAKALLDVLYDFGPVENDPVDDADRALRAALARIEEER